MSSEVNNTNPNTGQVQVSPYVHDLPANVTSTDSSSFWGHHEPEPPEAMPHRALTEGQVVEEPKKTNETEEGSSEGVSAEQLEEILAEIKKQALVDADGNPISQEKLKQFLQQIQEIQKEIKDQIERIEHTI